MKRVRNIDVVLATPDGILVPCIYKDNIYRPMKASAFKTLKKYWRRKNENL